MGNFRSPSAYPSDSAESPLVKLNKPSPPVTSDNALRAISYGTVSAKARALRIQRYMVGGEAPRDKTSLMRRVKLASLVASCSLTKRSPHSNLLTGTGSIPRFRFFVDLVIAVPII